ncbi:MAG: DUF6268 family outer membrane beta-barrel protein [Bacteroidota bacterium]|nr:DUF6268 family outer membrane beta-barrel protein [Candidatus Kapabacteria bacterium]MDW8219116.1 DUF6268 family outer membrane beta-barrel protein [Bacteroidota bacterium]
MMHRSVRSVLLLMLLYFSVSLGISYAQREQASIRYEVFGPRTIPSATPSLFNGATITGSLFTLAGGFQTQLDRDGTMILSNQLVYRNAFATFPIAKNPTTQDFTYGSITGHAIYYEGVYLQTLSEKFQLALALRAGLFSDLNNIDISHFRAEPLFFLDYFLNEQLTLGLGFVYNTSNFGRLISVPLLHIYWIPSSEILLDALVPTRLDLWYYPSKQWDLGLSVVLNGSQFQLGRAPGIIGIDRTDPSDNSFKRVADINQLFFANATIGPNIRYNLFEKTYVSIEGGYSIVRRFGFDAGSPVGTGYVPARTAAGEGYGDTNYIVSYLRGFDFAVNTWFLRLGMQIMY